MSDLIPLARFVPSSNSRERRQKEVSALEDRRRPVEESDDEESPLPIFASGKPGKAKPRLASQPAPLSDESDFDKDDQEEEDPKRGKKGRKGSKVDRKSGDSQGSRKNGSLLLKEELEVADDDSQTFAGFKMRIAAQEKTRIENERYNQQSVKGQKSQKRRSDPSAVINVDSDEEDFNFEQVTEKSDMSQSVQVSRRAPIQFPSLGESVPYFDLKRYRPPIVYEDDEESEDDEEVGVPEEDGKPRPSLLDLLVFEDKPKQSKTRKGTSHSGESSAEEPDSERDTQRRKTTETNGGKDTPVPETQRTDDAKPKADEILDDCDAYLDEDDQLIFDTKIGKLIRPGFSDAGSLSKRNLEEGQSEEEDGYQASIADEKAPKKSSSAYFLYEGQRSKIIAEENAKAEREAKRLEMRPSFRCSAAKQRKKPYSLDPFNSMKVIPVPINRFLRRYQRTGVQFFYDRYKGIKVEGIGEVKGGILGDDMGLGKTIQVLAFLSAIREKTGTSADLANHVSRKGRARTREGDFTPTSFGPTCLIICPKTLVTNWRREIETWTYLEAGVIESKSDRDQVINSYKNGFLDIVLVPFDRLVQDIEIFKTLHFSIMIIDEAHNIKNPKARRTLAMKKVKADCRFAMTGTLIQNRFSEMWSVLDFVVPGLVGTHAQWTNVMANKVDKGMDQSATVAELYRKKQVTDALHKNLLPLLFLRRTKAAVALELPQKNDHVIFCPLTPTGELVYKRLAAQPDLREYLDRYSPCPNHPKRYAKDCCYPADDEVASDEVDKGIFLRYISVFRKISSHIGLIYAQPDDSPEQKALCQRLLDICFPPSLEAQQQQIGLINQDQAEMYITKDAADIEEELQPTARDPYYRNLPPYQASVLSDLSGKWVILNALLRSWKDDDKGRHKVLVFSTSVKLLKMLQGFIQLEHNCEILHGGVKDEDRMAAVDRFQTDPTVFVFLISTLAGGVGLNLTAANKVVIFDPNWNPAHDLQAMDRAFRMGQKRDVDVYRLISLGTIEEIIYERQMRKSAAMRIIYENAADARVYEGYEARGVTGDLWGIKNLLTFKPEGTSLQRAARLAEEEEKLEDNLRGVITSRPIKTFKIDTIYEETDDLHVVGTEKGTELKLNEDATLLKALGDFIPGLRRENVKKTAAQPSAVERFIQEQAMEDYHKNPSARNKRANDHYKDEQVAKQVKRKRKSAQRLDDEGAETTYKAPRLNIGKSERPEGLVSDDED